LCTACFGPNGKVTFHEMEDTYRIMDSKEKGDECTSAEGKALKNKHIGTEEVKEVRSWGG